MKTPPLLALSLLLAAAAADAHEYWLLPDRFTAAPGETVAFEHRVGTGWPGETLARDPARVVRFDVVDALGRRSVDGAAGDDPAGYATVRAPGISMAVYRSNPTSIRLEPALFESYLRDEGLDDVVATRAARGETGLPGLERFSRCAKTLVVAPVGKGRRDAPVWKQPVGLTLELVPETDPRTLKRGGAFTARLLYLGQPMANALVKAFPKDGNERRLAVRTDADGRVRFDLPEGGVWLISTVHMIDAPPRSGARWESIWSSLTFELAP